ncbi:hypothetical protein B296_00033262 [Ensete ventricosum]|uniref:Glutamine amidotransferase domain-containing protein n=1 Tax=Ensete ventricosum TaxID=4639 RepID=A0A426YSW2_ENSVE|nr:hypothetical protein B296_00033262 [Ensete ventricosum]
MSAISWRPSVRGVARGLAPRPVLSPLLARRSLSLIPDLAARPISSLVARRRAHGGGLGNPGDAEDGEEEGDNEISSDDVVRTLLIDNYDSYTYNIYQELSVVNGGEGHLHGPALKSLYGCFVQWCDGFEEGVMGGEEGEVASELDEEVSKKEDEGLLSLSPSNLYSSNLHFVWRLVLAVRLDPLRSRAELIGKQVGDHAVVVGAYTCVG